MKNPIPETLILLWRILGGLGSLAAIGAGCYLIAKAPRSWETPILPSQLAEQAAHQSAFLIGGSFIASGIIFGVFAFLLGAIAEAIQQIWQHAFVQPPKASVGE